ncbi:MAG: hypothetical protein HYS51_01930 [Candidatus Zambryskibacteria bacterium]|nr:hypothetical protein [Candidatus Zambryskibacteria bacterium]
MNDKGKSEIEKLNETLNSRTRFEETKDERHQVKELDVPSVQEKWQSPELDEMLKSEREAPSPASFVRKVFVFAVLFFIATIIVAGFVFLGGANFVSSKNVEVNVMGPTMASAGETLELGVSIVNKNNADLEVSNLSAQYPQGARNPQNSSQALTFEKQELGAIRAGGEKTKNVRAIILGAIGDKKEFKFSVEYRVKGSNATFYKDKIFEVVIGDAPLTISVESPERVTSGEEFQTKISVTLNSPDILRDVVLKAEYPYGYAAISSAPTAAQENVWLLGDMSPGDTKTIIIRGKLAGQNEEERTSRFYAGVSDGKGARNLRIVLTSILNTVSIKRPAIGLDILLNGESAASYVVPAARNISAVAKFQNNLPDKLLDPRLEVRLSGSNLNKSSISAFQGGFYDSLNSKIVWQITSASGAQELAPGDSGQVNFTFASLPEGAPDSNAGDIKLDFVLSGIPVDAPSAQTVSVKESRSVKIASQVNLSAKAVRSSGPFTNRGSIPPKAERETTYSIIFNLKNTLGNIAPAVVTAKLGPGVKWIGAASAPEEDISYNSSSNTVTWDLGTLASSSGFSAASREIAFQVGLTPSTSQIGTAPILVSGINFLGRETDSGADLKTTSSSLTTRLTADPAFIQGDDIVVK